MSRGLDDVFFYLSETPAFIHPEPRQLIPARGQAISRHFRLAQYLLAVVATNQRAVPSIV